MRVSSPIGEVAVPIQPDHGPLARFEAVKADSGAPLAVFQRVAEGETLRDVAREWGVPVGVFTRWVMETHGDLYEAALRVRADGLAHGTLGIADGALPEEVGKAKLQVEARRWLAGKWDRERYGEKTDVRHSGLVPVLVIEVAAPAVTAGAAQPRVIEAERDEEPEDEVEPPI